MMRISLPGRLVVVGGLIAPSRPPLAGAARKQFHKRARTARLDNRILLVGLARVLALARRQQVHLAAAGRERSSILAAHAEQDQLGHVAEIKADAAPIRAAVLPDLVPDDVGLVGEAP